MPGFSIGNGGGDAPLHNQEFLRAHRWFATKIGPLRIDNRKLILKEMYLPNIDIEEEAVSGTTISYKFAARVKFEDVQLIFYDTSTLYNELVKWRAKVWTPETGLSVASEYKDECEFFQHSPTGLFGGATVPVTSFRLRNSWPKSISHSVLSYTDPDIKTVTLKLSFDWFEFKNLVAS